MKDSEIEVLVDVAALLEEYLPIKDYGLYIEYLDVLESVKAKKEKQSQTYQAKAEYHREISRKWRQENKERHNKYQKEYLAKKRAKKQDDKPTV